MIQSFSCKDTQALAAGAQPKKFRGLERQALRNLNLMFLAKQVEDLWIPPGNRLEKLAGNRAGQWSIWINDQWRVCFKWGVDGAEDVEIVDYH